MSPRRHLLWRVVFAQRGKLHRLSIIEPQHGVSARSLRRRRFLQHGLRRLGTAARHPARCRCIAGDADLLSQQSLLAAALRNAGQMRFCGERSQTV